MATTDISPVSPDDKAWFGWEFSALLAGVADVSGQADTLTGTPEITFEPSGPVAESVTVTGTKVVALLSGFQPPGAWVSCKVQTTQGQTIERGFRVACKTTI